MKPVIGITTSTDAAKKTFELGEGYVNSIKRASGIPLLIPPTYDCDYLSELAGRIDGLLLSGGVDIDPYHYGEEPETGLGRLDPLRDEFELELTRICLKANIPILAICRGAQVLNVAAGGTIIQHLRKDRTTIKHRQEAPRSYPTHKIKIQRGSLLHAVLKAESTRVNSFHHQAIGEAAPGFTVSARSEDGVIEAIEDIRHPFALGVQWHPETMQEFGVLFVALVDRAAQRPPVKEGTC